VTYTILAIVIGAAIGIFAFTNPAPLLVAAGVIGLIMAGITIFRVEIGLLVLIFISYLRISDIAIQFHGAPSIARPFIALLVLAIIVRWGLNGIRERGWIRAVLVVLAYGLVVFSSLLYAADFTRAQSAVSDYLKDGIITILIVVLLQKPGTFRAVIWTLLAAGAVTGTLSVFQYITGTFTNNYWGLAQANIQNIVTGTDNYRIAGPIGDPNFYAQTLLVIVPLALNRLRSEKNLLLRLIAGWVLVVTTLSIAFTFSRGAAVAFVVVVLALILYRPPRPLEVLGFLFVAILILNFVPSIYFDRLQTVTDLVTGNAPVQSEVSLRGRASELLVGLQMFREHPILGVGVKNYAVYYQSYSRRLGLDPRTTARDAHNLFIEVAAETGIVGLLVFLAIIWMMFRGMWNAWRMLRSIENRELSDMVAAYAIGVLGYLSAAMFIHNAYPRYFWMLVGISLALPQVARSAVEAHRQEVKEGLEA
jgi:O-antigen ligase